MGVALSVCLTSYELKKHHLTRLQNVGLYAEYLA